jgi:hypothetical protein
LQLEATGAERLQTELSVSYVDHNTLQDGCENADDQKYLQTVAAKYGILYSRAGNGICHQVHLERFARPGKTLLGSDSHTPTAGGIGCLAIGAGGLDVAAAMAQGTFTLAAPSLCRSTSPGCVPSRRRPKRTKPRSRATACSCARRRAGDMSGRHASVAPASCAGDNRGAPGRDEPTPLTARVVELIHEIERGGIVEVQPALAPQPLGMLLDEARDGIEILGGDR